MAKAILAAIVTFVTGFFTMCILPDPELGVIASVAVAGAFIIYFNEKKNSPEPKSEQEKE